ncbi:MULTISPECIES: glutaredoxin family protein [Gracilibacillus]|uniref:glutaredoxin family protein n=1 Tax=Gracilibacillus TaxID=74385 RepID=UPI00082720E2|nr:MULTISPECIES: glutaredoxin family protein [Gracilibacillus]
MEIIVYSTDLYIFCQKQKAFLESLGVDFVEKDIQKNEQYREEFFELDGTGTPLTVFKVLSYSLDLIH